MPFDVDRYDGLAVVVGHGRNRKGREVLGSDQFQQNDAGTWEHLTGSGSGWSPRQRWDLQEARDVLHLRMQGKSGKSPFDARREFSFAVFLCGPAVTTVQVDRRQGIRIADVSAGPGWLAVLWTPDDPAVVTALTADGRRSFLWNDERRRLNAPPPLNDRQPRHVARLGAATDCSDRRACRPRAYAPDPRDGVAHNEARLRPLGNRNLRIG